MFDSLEEKIKHDQVSETTRGARIVMALAVAVLSILLVGGLYLVVHLME